MIPRHTTLVSLLFATSCAQDPSSLPDAGDPDRPPCVGATRAQALAPDDPLVWRGVVSSTARKPTSASTWLIPTAHAVELPGEAPTAHATVTARLPDSPLPAITTTTDRLGRYCLRIHPAWADQPWALSATLPDHTTLRTIPHLPATIDLNTQTEAMFLTLTQAGVDPLTLPPNARLNLHTVADTALTLLSPTALNDLSPADAIALVAQTLRQDARWSALLKSP
jgi:hypothetical protein